MAGPPRSRAARVGAGLVPVLLLATALSLLSARGPAPTPAAAATPAPGLATTVLPTLAAASSAAPDPSATPDIPVSTTGDVPVAATGVEPRPPATTTLALAPESTAAPFFPSLTGGIPFGPHNLPEETYGTLFDGAVLVLAPDSAVEDLTRASDAGLRVVIDLSSGRRHFTNPDGTFNLDLWKARIDRFAGVDLAPFIADGTIIAHHLIDEAKARSRWGGQIVDNPTLDELARYSKQYWPDLVTTVRIQPSTLERHAAGYDVPMPDWRWQHLDTAWAQYASRKGPVEEYAAAEVAGAIQQGLGLIIGMNVMTGGDGSSGRASPEGYSGWAMTADEFRRYGTALLAQPYVCAFIMWRYDPDGYPYFAQADIASAAGDIARLAADHPPASCRAH